VIGQKQLELYDLLESPLHKKVHLKALVAQGMPLFLRPGDMPGFQGVDLITHARFLELFPGDCKRCVPDILSINLSRLYILAGLKSAEENGWVSFLQDGLPGYRALGLLTLEAYKLRFSVPESARLVLTSEELSDCLRGAASTIRSYHPLHGTGILRALLKPNWVRGEE